MSTPQPAANLELKVSCAETALDVIRARIVAASGTALETIRQIDTYFSARHGRLKLREIAQMSGISCAELIAYARPDDDGPRWSQYHRVSIDPTAASALRAALTAACGLDVTVVKTREVWILARTRVHLDHVEGLGTFVELETVVNDVTDPTAAEELARHATALGLDASTRIAVSYSDLVRRSSRACEDGGRD